MTKQDYISLLYLLVLQDQTNTRLVQGDNRAIILPYSEQGQRYLTGIRVIYNDGFNTFRRNFYFEDTMEEEFYRYINRKFHKGVIQREVENLFNELDIRDAA